MKCTILAIGQKMPPWCKTACDEYSKRLQRFMKCSFIEIPTSSKENESQELIRKISTTDTVIALEVRGEAWSTEQLSKNIANWQQAGNDLIFMIGGPDGLSSTCLQRANKQWSLSALTFPHMLVRVILWEQLYRATSFLANHPYHRE